MSSRELLVLLDGLPETSNFKAAAERAYRVVAYRGDKPELQGKQLLMRAVGRAPKDVEVVAEYVDWTYDRKLLARNTREQVALRGDGDFRGLIEPLQEILADLQQKTVDERIAKGRAHIEAGLYGLGR
jgi:hypothetical protein